MLPPAILGLGLLSFVVALGWAPLLLAALRRWRIGKQIRSDGPATHLGKAGTPTMGGWLMTLTTAALSLAFLRAWPTVLVAVAGMIAFAVLGAIDDYANLRSPHGYGLRVRLKFAVHSAVALGLALALDGLGEGPETLAPGFGRLYLGALFVPLAALVIFATAAAVNETDGLDGLAAGTCALAFAAYLLVALRNGQTELAALCAILLGSLLAFLWFNIHPARVFMGDTGSLALGAALATVALLTGGVLLLPVVGLVFVLETLSVIVQVAYFKASGGKRLLKMSPLHHHLELSGWSETRTVRSFWLASAVAGAAGVAIAGA